MGQVELGDSGDGGNEFFQDERLVHLARQEQVCLRDIALGAGTQTRYDGAVCHLGHGCLQGVTLKQGQGFLDDRTGCGVRCVNEKAEREIAQCRTVALWLRHAAQPGESLVSGTFKGELKESQRLFARIEVDKLLPEVNDFLGLLRIRCVPGFPCFLHTRAQSFYSAGMAVSTSSRAV